MQNKLFVGIFQNSDFQNLKKKMLKLRLIVYKLKNKVILTQKRTNFGWSVTEFVGKMGKNASIITMSYYVISVLDWLTSNIRAQSWTVRAIGPRWSSVGSIDIAPVYGTRPQVGFKPTDPFQHDGIRMEPPWSPPIAMSTWPVINYIVRNEIYTFCFFFLQKKSIK